MDENQQKEQFSNAYIRAIAATAGYSVYKPEVDDDSVDWGVTARGGNGTYKSPKVEMQLKCTSKDILKDGVLSFPLKIKNYDDLRPDNYQVPRILVVVLVPGNVSDWLLQTPTSLALHRCGYWVSLNGKDQVSNTSTVTITIPESQMFSVMELSKMMDRIRQGGQP